VEDFEHRIKALEDDVVPTGPSDYRLVRRLGKLEEKSWMSDFKWKIITVLSTLFMAGAISFGFQWLMTILKHTPH
jgi:hypothetical protein